MRFEYKFIVPHAQLDELRAELRPFVEYDQYAAQRENHHYTVRSIYFETPRFDCYHEKVDGLKVRRKIRVRAYNAPEADSVAFLEIKKRIDQRGAKHRSMVRAEQLGALFAEKDLQRYVLPGRNADEALDDAQRFFYHVERRVMKPVVLVTYEREAFQGKVDQTLRVTFDKHLRYMAFPALDDLFEEERLQYVAPRFFILEIKFDRGYAAWLQQIVQKHNVVHTRLSKYTTALEASSELRPLLDKRFLPRAERVHSVREELAA
jgi:hypothetical protein